MSVDVVCLGETMALIAPDPPRPLAVADHLVLSHAGAESNVAVSLAWMGSRTRWCSRLGDDAFGHRILREISAAGVGVELVELGPARTGVFFKDPGPAGTGVLYYRDGSAASTMDETDVDRALADPPRILHLTGITPALSPSCARAVDYAVGRAHDSGVVVSFDVNHRPPLWRAGSDPASALLRLAERCDIVLVGLDEAAILWGTLTAVEVRELIGTPGVLVVKDGPGYASSFRNGEQTQVSALSIDVVEAVGAGDAFAAGWLHGWLTGLSPAAALRLGHLLAAASLASATDHGAALAPPDALLDLVRDGSAWPPQLSSSTEPEQS